METPTLPPSTSPTDPGREAFHLQEEQNNGATDHHHENLVDHAVDEQQELLSSSRDVTPNGPSSDLAPLHQSSPPFTPSPMPRSVPVTRTVAIIKNHALQYRFDIEPRIQEASFEVSKTYLNALRVFFSVDPCHYLDC